MKAHIDKNKCPSDPHFCKPLTECPTKAMSWVQDEEEAFGSRMEIDEDKCIVCGKCIKLCCAHSIEIK